MTGNEKTIASAGKYLTFVLGHENYGIPVVQVREIIKIMDVTPVPQVPAHVKGIINLRGRIVPVFDLRVKFEQAIDETNERSCIIVTEVRIDDRALHLGMVVDAVSEVVQVAAEDIEPPPDFGARMDTDYMRGIAKVKGHVFLLLDLDRVVGGSDLRGVAA